ncbi:hypothetical protein [Methanosarcina horonobensis]|nr:hypothetical protein [Methanosarcina horonobensis]
MSEIPSSASTPGQNSTHQEGITLPDLNFSIHLHVTLTADSALQAALERIAEALKPVQKEPEPLSRSEVVFRGLKKGPAEERCRPFVGPKPDEIEPLSEEAKTKEPVKKKSTKVYWIDIPNHPHLRYREEDGKLILNYAGSIVETTWQQVENTARLDQKYWNQEIAKILGNRQASNRKAAVNLFLKLVEKGEVSKVTISKFQAEEDDTG